MTIKQVTPRFVPPLPKTNCTDIAARKENVYYLKEKKPRRNLPNHKLLSCFLIFIIVTRKTLAATGDTSWHCDATKMKPEMCVGTTAKCVDCGLQGVNKDC